MAKKDSTLGVVGSVICAIAIFLFVVALIRYMFDKPLPTFADFLTLLQSAPRVSDTIFATFSNFFSNTVVLNLQGTIFAFLIPIAETIGSLSSFTNSVFGFIINIFLFVLYFFKWILFIA